MALRKVTEKIVKDAENKADEIRKQFREEADEILKKADEEVERIHKEGRQRIEEELALLKRKNEASINLETRKKVLSLKHSILDSVFEKAIEKLIRDPSYPELLKNLIEKNVSDDRAMVVLSEEDCRRFGTTFEKAKLSDPALIRGGAIIKTERMENNLSIEMTLTQMRDELIVELAKILFD